MKATPSLAAFKNYLCTGWNKPRLNEPHDRAKSAPCQYLKCLQEFLLNKLTWLFLIKESIVKTRQKRNWIRYCQTEVTFKVFYVAMLSPKANIFLYCLTAVQLLQTTLASSPWEQSCIPQPSWVQLKSEASPPWHPTWSIQIGPTPLPYAARRGAEEALEKPSWRHTTFASLISQVSSHTVPHIPFTQTSTRP